MACSADTAFEPACSIDRLPGAQPICRVQSAADGRIFAAKWKLVDSAIAPDQMDDIFIACRAAGSASVTRRSDGASMHRRPTIGAVTWVDGRMPAEWRIEGACEVWHVYLPADALQRFAEEDLGVGTVPTIRPLFAAEDPWLKGYFQMLASEFEPSANAWQQADPLFTAQAEHLLIHHLLASHSDASPKASNALSPAHAVNAMRPVALKRVQDYIAANLSREIELTDLAAVACTSVGHFLRGFRAASGMTPHRYVQEQRLAHARELLLTTRLPVSLIATECGFKTASHLSAKFRSRMGTSPSRFRACVEER